MKKYLPFNLSSRAGFTMIELLVVIAVIGVLAVAVLSSINPIEQINKGRDTRKRSNAAQLINAVDRFYAIQELYPWNDATYNGQATDSDPAIAFPDGTVCTASTDPAGFCQIGGTGYTAPAVNWLEALTSTDEVKDSFLSQIEDTSVTNALFVYKGLDEDLYVCFEPASKQFQLEAIDGCISRAAILPDDACPQATYTASTQYDEELICLP